MAFFWIADAASSYVKGSAVAFSKRGRSPPSLFNVTVPCVSAKVLSERTASNTRPSQLPCTQTARSNEAKWYGVRARDDVFVSLYAPTDVAPCNRQTSPPKWEKVLYTTQPFEDNYVDDTFLEQMKTNGTRHS